LENGFATGTLYFNIKIPAYTIYLLVPSNTHSEQRLFFVITLMCSSLQLNCSLLLVTREMDFLKY